MPDQPTTSPIGGLVEQLLPLDQDFLRSAAAVPVDRKAEYTRAESYYDGDQGTKLTDRAQQFLENSGLQYNENFCETVVDALADRLRVSGVSCDDEDLATFIWDVLWDRNRLDAQQGTIHTEVLKLGDGFLVVDFDAAQGRPTVVFNAPDRCQVRYEDGTKVWAAKTWDTSAKGPLNPSGQPLVRMNLYWPDRIEKFFRLSSDESGDWSHWVDEGDPSWPLDWTTPGGKPVGIPVFHLANKAGTRKYGRAEHRGTIPQQDALNKTLIDLASVQDTLGFPQRYISGDDATGELQAVPGTIWRSKSPETTFGQFEAADLSGFLAAIEAQLFRIAARSRTPAHLIVVTGGTPSGEALKTAEAGLVAKARDRASTWGEEWIGTLRMMAVLAALHGDGELRPNQSIEEIERATLNIAWADPETRNEKEHLEALGLMADLGVGKRTILSKIPGVDADKELEESQATEADAAEQLMAAVNNGGVPLMPGQGRPVRTGPPPGTPLAGAAARTAEAFGKPPVVGA